MRDNLNIFWGIRGNIYLKSCGHCPTLLSPPASVLLDAKTSMSYTTGALRVASPFCVISACPSHCPFQLPMLSSQAALSPLNWWQTMWLSAALYSFPPIYSGLEAHPWPSWPVRFLLLIILNWDQVLNWLGLPADVDSDGKNCHFEQNFGARWLINKENVLVYTAERGRRACREELSKESVSAPERGGKKRRENYIWFLLCPRFPWSGFTFAFDSRNYPSSLG